MKVSKDALRHARVLFKACLKDGRLDRDKVRNVVKRVAEEKPRDYLGILNAFYRLVRLELEKRHVLVESATPLSQPLQDEVLGSLGQRYGDDLTHEFKVVPELLGGMRVKVGSDIWDGSVRARLERLSQSI